jgi:hypothetical protein
VTANDDRTPRRFIGLWWDPTANQLGWSDGQRRGVGQLDRQVWSAWLHAGGLLGLVVLLEPGGEALQVGDVLAGGPLTDPGVLGQEHQKGG